MKTQEDFYDERLKKGPSAATVVVRVVYTAVIIMLACVALLMHLQTTAYNRAETAYYHLADILVKGGEPDYDSVSDGVGHIDTAESLGLTASKYWETSAEVNADKWITTECRLCSPFLEGLNIDIHASFPYGDEN